MMLTFIELKAMNFARCEEKYHPITDWSPTDWACAIGGECGEALNFVKKLRRLTGPTDKTTLGRIQNDSVKELIDNIGKELADVVIYADLLATRLGLSLGECVANKFNETSEKIGSTRMLTNASY
jgi:NTP pyrophosphatase (non-canonical NTP hydrolase)